MGEKLVFENSLDGLFQKGLGAKVTPALRAELKAMGIDLGKTLPPVVTRETWYLAINAAAKHCFPSLERKVALRSIGVHLIKGVSETVFGRAMAPMVRLLGPRRLLQRVPKQMKSSNNFADGVVTALGPTALQFDLSDCGDAPEVFQGSLDELARWAGAKDIEVSCEFTVPPAARFVIRWAE